MRLTEENYGIIGQSFPTLEEARELHKKICDFAVTDNLSLSVHLGLEMKTPGKSNGAQQLLPIVIVLGPEDDVLKVIDSVEPGPMGTAYQPPMEEIPKLLMRRFMVNSGQESSHYDDGDLYVIGEDGKMEKPE